MSDELTQLRAKLAELEALKRTHFECEDGWYSCPKSEEGCYNEHAGTDCTCGADRHNEKVQALIDREKLVGEADTKPLVDPADITIFDEGLRRSDNFLTATGGYWEARNAFAAAWSRIRQALQP